MIPSAACDWESHPFSRARLSGIYHFPNKSEKQKIQINKTVSDNLKRTYININGLDRHHSSCTHLDLHLSLLIGQNVALVRRKM
jgi:hypothetical protein